MWCDARTRTFTLPNKNDDHDDGRQFEQGQPNFVVVMQQMCVCVCLFSENYFPQILVEHQDNREHTFRACETNEAKTYPDDEMVFGDKLNSMLARPMR